MAKIKDKMRIKHPSDEKIERYILGELKEEEELSIGGHISECKECLAKVRDAFKLHMLWESWTAKTHGEAYWRKRMNEVLEGSLKTAAAPGIQRRLETWAEKWKGKAGGVVQIILERAEKTGEVITGLPRNLLAPDYSWQFTEAAARVRGIEKGEGEIKVIGKERPDVQVITDVANRKVLIQIEETEKRTPLVILAPEKGKPKVVEPTKVEGTNFYAACFEDVPPGEYMLIFEPEEK